MKYRKCLWSMKPCFRSTGYAGSGKSNRKSPPVTVFRDGGAYKIALTYHLDAVVVGTIHQSGGIIWADLLGRVQLAYDREEDRLVLATEGIYVRADDS